jgi:hypothetical protein
MSARHQAAQMQREPTEMTRVNLQADADDGDDLRGGDQAVHKVIHAVDDARILLIYQQEKLARAVE